MFPRSLLRGFSFTIIIMGLISTINARHVISYLASQVNKFSDASSGRNVIMMEGNEKSFPAALKEMDDSVQAELNNKKSCEGFHPQKPNFRVEGRRVSEMKCLDYIWDLKIDEGTKMSASQCNRLSGVVGGKLIQKGEYRHMVAIGWTGEAEGKWEFKCGGSLISQNFVLTAAHCRLDDNKKTPEIVRFGVVNLTDDENALDKKIAKFIRHPRYIPQFKNFDIAVIKLANKVRFSKYIQPACILSQANVVEAVISGWGATSAENGKVGLTSNDLLVAKVDILPSKDCRRRWRQKRDKEHWRSYFKDEQICATGTENVADICAGDSGSPLQTDLNITTSITIHNIVGTTAFNYECGSRNFPSVYTNVKFHIDWIEQEVWGEKSPANTGESSQNGKTESSKITESTPESAMKINNIQHFNSGYLFTYDTPGGGSGWNYISEMEIARINKEREINTRY